MTQVTLEHQEKREGERGWKRLRDKKFQHKLSGQVSQACFSYVIAKELHDIQMSSTNYNHNTIDLNIKLHHLRFKRMNREIFVRIPHKLYS